MALIVDAVVMAGVASPSAKRRGWQKTWGLPITHTSCTCGIHFHLGSATTSFQYS